MFVRVKKIKGQRYGYLVQNSWTKEGTRQKVGKYLGKVHRPEKKLNATLSEHFNLNLNEFVAKNDLKSIVHHLVLLELHNHGLPKEAFDPLTLTFTEQTKGKVLEINQGYLCQATLEKVLAYQSEADEGFALAELLLAAGLNVEKELFVELFEKLRPKTAPQESGDFYF